MTDGIRMPDVPLGTTPDSLFGIEDVAGIKEGPKRFTLASVKAVFDDLDPEVAPDPFVILGTGQSNMRRESAFAWDAPANLTLWDWPKTQAGIGTQFLPVDDSLQNVAWAFGARMAREQPKRDVRVINISTANVGINEWLPTWSVHDMMNSIEINVEPALDLLGRDHIDCMLWYQGENDAAAPEDYYTNHIGVMNIFRNFSWFRQNTPVVVFGMVPSVVSGNPTHDVMSFVLEAVAARESYRRIFVPTRKLETDLWEDTLHLLGEGYDEAGELAYNMFSGRNHHDAHGIHGKVTLADDQAAKIPMPFDAGHIIFTIENVVSANGSFDFSTGTGAVGRSSAGTNAAITTGVLAGTTGADAKATYSAANDGCVYVENRLGANRTFFWEVIGGYTTT